LIASGLAVGSNAADDFEECAGEETPGVCIEDTRSGDPGDDKTSSTTSRSRRFATGPASSPLPRGCLLTSRIREKLTRAEANLRKVRKNTPSSFEGFASLGIVKDGVDKNPRTGSRTCWTSVLSSSSSDRWAFRTSRKGSPTSCSNTESLSSEEKQLLDDLRGLRKRLVRRYGTIDDEIVYQRIRNDLDRVDALVDALRDRTASN
jgi:hypothetical protein